MRLFFLRPMWAGNSIVRWSGGKRLGGYFILDEVDEFYEGFDCVSVACYLETFSWFQGGVVFQIVLH